jgi:hypothetical protein
VKKCIKHPKAPIAFLPFHPSRGTVHLRLSVTSLLYTCYGNDEGVGQNDKRLAGLRQDLIRTQVPKKHKVILN